MAGVLVITGGSRGIGAATARLGAHRGYKIAIVYRSAERTAHELASEITRGGGAAQAFRADVSNPEEVSAAFNAIGHGLGSLGGLVTAAGITGGAKSILEVDPAMLQEVIAVNLLGTFYCVQAAARRMSRSRGGKGGAIVTVSSEAGRFGGNRLAAYAAAKAGVNTLTIGAARELAEDGIRINAVSPGVIDTDQHAGQTPERLAGLLSSIPLKRMGRAEEVAQAIMWLLSDEASYTTGSILSVHGGR